MNQPHQAPPPQIPPPPQNGIFAEGLANQVYGFPLWQPTGASLGHLSYLQSIAGSGEAPANTQQSLN